MKDIGSGHGAGIFKPINALLEVAERSIVFEGLGRAIFRGRSSGFVVLAQLKIWMLVANHLPFGQVFAFGRIAFQEKAKTPFK